MDPSTKSEIKTLYQWNGSARLDHETVCKLSGLVPLSPDDVTRQGVGEKLVKGKRWNRRTDQIRVMMNAWETSDIQT